MKLANIKLSSCSVQASFMKRALELAQNPSTTCLPNPRVGAVIVFENKIVSEGFHAGPGQAHAEVMAIRAAESKGFKNFSDSQIYITLEPCSHLKKRTPPCAPLLVEKAFQKVIVASLDPNPQVSGSGIKLLKSHHIDVELGLLKDQAESLNQDFIKNQLRAMPYITLKVAMSFDGCMADDFGKSQWITGPEARQLTQELRARADSLGVGSQTFDRDNPRLNLRLENYTEARRVIVFGSPKRNLKKSKAAAANGIENIINLKSVKSLKQQLKTLYLKNGVCHLLVEGGPRLAQSFLKAGLVDELVLAYGSGFMMGQGKYWLGKESKPSHLKKIQKFTPEEVKLVGGNILARGRLNVYRSC